MDIRPVVSFIERAIPIALLIGLVGDWARMRMAHRAEERRHIARAIADLLQLRFVVRSLPEIPKQVSEFIPKEFKDQIPPDFWRLIDFSKLIPMDEEFPKRYRKAVEEIAGFRPVLAYQLRDKEKYFDLRNIVSQHFSQAPGSPLVANRITELLDREAVAALDETISLLAKAHGIGMRVSITLALSRRHRAGNVIPPEIQRVFHEQILQVVKEANSQAPQKPSQT